MKEINGGTVRYVVNGTYRVCTDPQRRRAVSENYGWNWTRTSPYYKKVPIYLEDDLLAVDMVIQRMSIPTLVGELIVLIIIGRRRKP